MSIAEVIIALQQKIREGVPPETELEVIKGAFAYNITGIKQVYSKLEEREVLAVVTT